MKESEKKSVIRLLNQIMEMELAGVVRYTHYSLMVFGYGRIPIVGWLKGNADESLAHAQRAGEMVTMLGGHPSLGIGPLLESNKHDISDILKESLDHEKAVAQLYYQLLDEVQGRSVVLEEYAREMIVTETLHEDEVDKMLRKPGEMAPFDAQH